MFKPLGDKILAWCDEHLSFTTPNDPDRMRAYVDEELRRISAPPLLWTDTRTEIERAIQILQAKIRVLDEFVPMMEHFKEIKGYPQLGDSFVRERRAYDNLLTILLQWEKERVSGEKESIYRYQTRAARWLTTLDLHNEIIAPTLLARIRDVLPYFFVLGSPPDDDRIIDAVNDEIQKVENDLRKGQNADSNSATLQRQILDAKLAICDNAVEGSILKRSRRLLRYALQTKEVYETQRETL